MKHGAKNRSNTRKILNNNNVHTHARTHAPTHPPTLFFWLTSNLKHSINYNKTKFLKQQDSFHASLLQAIHGVIFLALCPQVMSQAHQHLMPHRLGSLLMSG